MFSVSGKCNRLVVFGLASMLAFSTAGYASDQFTLNLPRHSKPTPVQKYNRDGVAAIKKHNYEKAKKLFYRAYLLDPNDPFTLNNLGYVAELEGDVDSAQRFYDLAAAQNSQAVVATASSDNVTGKPVSLVAGHSDTKEVMVNRYNVNAIGLLLKNRTSEAEILLNKALAIDPHNPFTLNNLGYAKEQEGELEDAIRYYEQAADLHSNEPVVVTVNKNWRGKEISQVAENNAEKVEKTLAKSETQEQQVARLNLRGVAALNRNEPAAAKKDFEAAYKLAPTDAFTLNNMGYVSEMLGDKESADFYYAKAHDAEHSNDRVTLASRLDVEGQKLHEVASENGTSVDSRMEAELALKRRQKGPAVLHRRDNSVVNPTANDKANPQEQNVNPDSTKDKDDTQSPDQSDQNQWHKFGPQ